MSASRRRPTRAAVVAEQFRAGHAIALSPARAAALAAIAAAATRATDAAGARLELEDQPAAFQALLSRPAARSG